MGVFTLKYRDTQPVLDVTLKNPDLSVHDLTGETGFKLHIKLDDGTVVTRTMTMLGAATAGTLRYSWLSTDWNAGNLVVGTHHMEYEVVSARLTFPNKEANNDTLFISSDIGQG